MIHLTDQQLQDINDSFPWQTGITLPDGRILGNKDRLKGKHKNINLLEEWLIEDNINLFGMNVLELGCAEGSNTIELSKIFRSVDATDVRPRNIIGAQIRDWVLDLDNIYYFLADMNKYQTYLHTSLVYHTGVLYHLINPIEHLQYIASITDNLFLSTRCYDEESEIKSQNIRIDDYVKRNSSGCCSFYQHKVKEKLNNWDKSFAGIEPYSIWLHKDDITDILHYVGFTSVTKLFESRSYCPKVVYMATK